MEGSPRVRQGCRTSASRRLPESFASARFSVKSDPSDADAQLNIGLDESFPSSDAPSNTVPGSGEPAPSSGLDPEAERKIVERRERAYAIWEQEGRPEGRHDEHWHRAGSKDAPEPGTAAWIEGP